MISNEYGQVKFTSDEIISMIYCGQNIDDCGFEDQQELHKHNSYSKNFGIEHLSDIKTIKDSPIDYHATLSSNWKMPDHIKNMDVFHYLSDQLVAKGYTGNEYKQRLLDEFNEYKSRNMLNVIKFLKYLMDTCMANNIVLGIGRGSSVSSLLLHLLDVHYIDPVKYNLDYKEFLR